MSSSSADRAGNALDGIELALFQSRLQAVCNEMGVALRRAAFSPNIKDRLDFSCALFDEHGALFGQAAHIPVHLGSMAYAMADVVSRFDWQAGDLVLVNDPFLGGTHLPDVTAVSPVVIDGEPVAFAACRAHHANIGAERPGSMPVARRLEEEGVIVPPMLALRSGVLTDSARGVLDRISARSHAREADYHADVRLGDFFAQFSATRLGVQRVIELVEGAGVEHLKRGIVSVNDYAERMARRAIAAIPHGRYAFADVMDDDGFGREGVRIAVTVTVDEEGVTADFDGTDAQVEGNINCPRSVTAAATYYVFRCLMARETPGASGAFRPIRLLTRAGSLVDARPPAAVAAGNVETSMRIVDVLLGALAAALPDVIPAASQGTMNNLALGARIGNEGWDYYETIAGGTGAHARADGVSGIHSHMTNTLNTPIESLEMHYPLRVTRYALRRGSGGSGHRRGGDGLIREIEFLTRTEVTLLTERRRIAPWGLAGGGPGAKGCNLLNTAGGGPGVSVPASSIEWRVLPGKSAFTAEPGDRLRIETPGGGGHGAG